MTPKQREALGFLRAFIAEYSHSPSFDEVRQGLNLASKSGVYRLMDALQHQGYIRRLRYRGRTVELLDAKVQQPLNSVDDLVSSLYDNHGFQNENDEQMVLISREHLREGVINWLK